MKTLDRIKAWLSDFFEIRPEPDHIRNPFFRDIDPDYKAPETIYHGRLADPKYRESLEYERHADFIEKSLAKNAADENFTGGIAPTAWDDMELEQSISFASLTPDGRQEAETIDYNPLHPETVDDLLPPRESPESPSARQEFSDEVIIMTEKPRPETPPLLENYMNM